MARSQRAPRWAGHKPPVGTPLDRSHPLALGLVGAYLLDEGGGATVLNATGQTAPGSIASGLSWSAGPWGSALQGSATSKLSLGQQTLFNPTTAISLAATFVTPASWTDTWHPLISKSYTEGVWSAPFALYMLRANFHNTNNTGLEFGVTLGTTYFAVNMFQTELALSTRYVAAGTWDTTTATVAAYLNGALIASRSDAVGTMNTRTSTTYIAYDDGAEHFNGLISSAFIWTRALTPDEVQQLTLNPLCLSQPLRRVFATRPEPWPIGYAPPGGALNANAVYRM